ncbi:ribosomal protein L1p/L10e family-domain-containing protein [Coprinopsis sp. MPI-PUGE-AT-0042]|nr:ribosomal protein L1p/L10e family-domain-containing protein [Coprinopsis sp. MPI-PUGE-AT-0042]
MAVDELIDEHVSLQQSHIWLNVTVKKIPPGHRIKPVKVPVVHPLVDPRTSSICLITKDPQREYKDLLETHKIKFISRVVGVEKLKGKFKPYEARRALLKENGMFWADERVVPLLPSFSARNGLTLKIFRQPIPSLSGCISSTYMNQNQGTCTSIKIATLSHKPSQVLANLQKADGWEKQPESSYQKTNSSVSLPIWTCAPRRFEEGRWHNLEQRWRWKEKAQSLRRRNQRWPRSKGKEWQEASVLPLMWEMEEAPKKRSKSTKRGGSKDVQPSKSDSAPAGASKPASTKKSTKKVKHIKGSTPSSTSCKASEKARLQRPQASSSSS